MKTNCKRLLSLVVALVMILVMIPVFQIQADAVDLDTLDWANINANFDPKTATTCPFCEGTVTWVPVTVDARSTADVHYYVPEGTTTGTDFKAIATQAAGTNAKICLYLTPGTALKARVYLRDGDTANIFGNGTLQRRHANKDNAAVVALTGNVKANIYGGVIKGCSGVTTNGGVIDMHGGSAEKMSTLNIGGTALIQDGETTAYGGSIYCEYTNVTISGSAQITGGEASFGGNIFAEKATKIMMTGGTVEGGNAITGGGNFLLNNNASLNVAGTSAENKAIIRGGESGAHGGNIFVNKATASVTVGENAEISGGKAITSATGQGGNIYMAYGNLTINGGTISGGQSSVRACNIGATGNAVITMTGGTVENGTTKGGEKNNLGLLGNTAGAAVMYFQGGTVDNGDLLLASADNKVYLSGNATVDPEDSKLTSEKDAKVYILAGWSGAACFDQGLESATYGTEIPNVTTGTLDENLEFTAGDVAYTGKLTCSEFKSADVVLDERTDAVGDMAVGYIRFMDRDIHRHAMWATGLNNYDIEKHFFRIVDSGVEGDEFKLTKDAILDVAGRGYDFTFTSDDDVSLYLIDEQNDGYDAAKCGNVTIGGKVNVENDVTVFGKRYITVEENDSYTAHRVSMEITGVLLDIGNEGVAFQSKFQADETIQSKLNGYGVVTSLDNMPGANFAEENVTAGQKINAWTMVTAKDLPADGIVNGHVIGNIVENGATDTIFANLHMTVGDYTLVTDNVNTKVSMKGVMDAIDAYWNAENFLNEGQKTQIEEFVAANSEYLNGFTNIGK